MDGKPAKLRLLYVFGHRRPPTNQQQSKEEKTPMKTTATTTATASKTGLSARCLAFLLAAFTLTFAPQWALAAGDVPFKGSAEGAVVSATPGAEGVVLMVAAAG